MADAGSSEDVKRRTEVEKQQQEMLDAVAKDFPFWTRKQLEEFKEKFAGYDEDNSGDLDFFEVQKMMEKLGKVRRARGAGVACGCPTRPATTATWPGASQTMTHLELKEMIKEVDDDNDGKVSFREFLVVRARREGARGFDRGPCGVPSDPPAPRRP